MIVIVGRLATAALLVAAAACYAPATREGIPCGPGDACPSDQTCDPVTSHCVRTLSPNDAATDGAPVDTPIDAAVSEFVDTFSRPDGAAIGNGWIEKNPAAFSITGDEATRVGTSLVSYRDNLVYRPAGENVLDVEVSVQVRITSLPPRFPQIFVRARTATITAANSYDGYLLYVDGDTVADQVVLGRQLGNVFVETLSQFTLSEPLTTAGRYRFVLRAQGTAPVMLAARVEKLAGTTWTTIGSTTADDTAAECIAEPGTVGFAGDEFARYIYDDFRRTML